MSVRTLDGFVVVDGENVLTFEQLREIGFIGPTTETEYLSGAHGINGLFQLRPTPKQTELMDNHGLSLALVQTPFFSDHRLAMEPEMELCLEVREDHGETMDFAYLNGFTQVTQSSEEDTVLFRGKLSISMYSSNAPQKPVNLMTDIGWSSPAPVMPSPEDVLKQLGSQKSLEEQFAEAFAKPAPAPTFTNPGAGFKPQVSPPPAPAPIPVVKQTASTHEDLMKSMFGRFLG